MYRDRIIGFERIPVDQLKPHPENWRHHNAGQRKALRTALENIGIIDAIIVRPHEDGYQIIDGHLRHDLYGGHAPALIVDLDDREAQAGLASLDPINQMAELDVNAYADLLDQLIEPEENPAMKGLFAELRDMAGLNFLELQPDDMPDGTHYQQTSEQHNAKEDTYLLSVPIPMSDKDELLAALDTYAKARQWSGDAGQVARRVLECALKIRSKASP